MANNAMHPVGTPLGANNNTNFGTDGVRGKAGTELTPALALQLGYWSSHVLTRQGPVLLGKDSRQSGDMITAALTACLLYTSPSPRDGLLSRMPSSA